MATRGFAACVSLLSHHRSVDAANPWPAANDTALAPLARHDRTRSVHFAAVSASLMPQTMRPNRTPRKDGVHTGHTKKAMRAALDLGERGVLVTGRLDRLGRDALDTQEVVALLLDHGVRIVSLKDGIDSASGLGGTVLKLLTNILAGFAELERDTIRQRLLDGRRRAEREGRLHASEPRYGRRLAEDGNTVVDDVGEMAAVERARVLRDEGVSFRAIAQRLGEEGHRPRRAAVWSAVVVRRLVLGARGVPVPVGKRLGRARTDTMFRRLLATSVDDRASSTAP